MSLKIKPFQIYRDKIVVYSPYHPVRSWPAFGMKFEFLNELLHRKLIESYIITKEETYFVEKSLPSRSRE